MTHDEAKSILEESDAQITLDEGSGVAQLNGQFSIEELHAVLQLLEYNA